MAKNYSPVRTEPKPLIAMTTLGTTHRCTVRVRKSLEREGYEVMVFHTLGTGGMAMDQIVRERDVTAVLDLSLVEINDYLNNGLCSAGPDRAKAALEKGVPEEGPAGVRAGDRVRLPHQRYAVRRRNRRAGVDLDPLYSQLI